MHNSLMHQGKSHLARDFTSEGVIVWNNPLNNIDPSGYAVKGSGQGKGGDDGEAKETETVDEEEKTLSDKLKDAGVKVGDVVLYQGKLFVVVKRAEGEGSKGSGKSSFAGAPGEQSQDETTDSGSSLMPGVKGGNQSRVQWTTESKLDVIDRGEDTRVVDGSSRLESRYVAYTDDIKYSGLPPIGKIKDMTSEAISSAMNMHFVNEYTVSLSDIETYHRTEYVLTVWESNGSGGVRNVGQSIRYQDRTIKVKTQALGMRRNKDGFALPRRGIDSSLIIPASCVSNLDCF